MGKKQQCIDNDESEDLVSDSSRNTLLLDSQQQQRLFREPDETARNDDGYCEFITQQLFHDDNNYDTVQYPIMVLSCPCFLVVIFQLILALLLSLIPIIFLMCHPTPTIQSSTMTLLLT